MSDATAPAAMANPDGSGWRSWLCGRAAWAVVAGVGAAFIVAFTVPWQPADEAPIGAFDFSWMLVLHDAFATGRQFGKAIILPQGPLGFIGNDVYDPRTHAVVLALRIVIALTVFWTLWRVARQGIARPMLALPWLVVIVALMGRSADHFYPTCAVLTLFTYFVAHDRRLGPAVFALAVVLAASSLIKVNQPFYAVVAVGTIALDQLLRRAWRPVAALPLTYAASVLLFYFAARQKPSSLGAFLWGWKQVTAGHADAVGQNGPWVDAAAYLLVVALVLALVARFAWRRWRGAGWPLVAGTAGVLLLLYKHSFMRQDIHHVHMGPMVAVATLVLFMPAFWRTGERRLRIACVVALCISATVLTSILSGYTGQSLAGYAGSVAQRCAVNLAAAARHVTDPGRLTREWEDARGQVRRSVPIAVEKIEGGVDVYPHRQDVVFAYGLPYAPRPVISSLVATAPILAALNAAHLRGPSAPRTVLFDVERVDNNHPMLLDGASLPELLTRYDVIDPSGGMLVLRRSPAPRVYRLTPLLTKTARFEETVPIPEVGDAPLWARVRFRKRIAGRVIALLHKPPTLGIELRLRDGSATSYRLLPSLAEEQGFLLSPHIADRAAYARLASPTWASDLGPAGVTSITLFVAAGSQDASFDPQFELELRRLEIEPRE